MKTEKEKMLLGEKYFVLDKEIQSIQANARRLTKLYNNTTSEECEERFSILKELLGGCTEATHIEPDFKCDFGINIYFKGFAVVNFDVLMLDTCPINIGENAFIGPRTCIYTVLHDMLPSQRNKPECFGKPVNIGNNVWLGGNVVVLPGVTIGDNVVVGAGSVVTKDIPNNVLAAGNPAKVIRKIEDSEVGNVF